MTSSRETLIRTHFKRDVSTYLHVHSFLSQMFEYGNTAIEKRAVTFKRLLPLMDFGSEREGSTYRR